MQELTALEAEGDPDRAIRMAAYHKADRRYLGIDNQTIDRLVAGWRHDLDLAERVALAARLWSTDIHEARIAAARLLTQARMTDDGEVWRLITLWAEDFDSLAISDRAMIAAQKRLLADPARLEQLAAWTRDPNPWKRRATLTGTLPWAKMNHPRRADLAIRERVLSWAADLAGDGEWPVQKAIADWLYHLSKRDEDRVLVFLDQAGDRLQPFARREASRKITT